MGEGKKESKAVWSQGLHGGGRNREKSERDYIPIQFIPRLLFPVRPQIRGPPPHPRNMARIITTPSLLPLSLHPSPTPPRPLVRTHHRTLPLVYPYHAYPACLYILGLSPDSPLYLPDQSNRTPCPIESLDVTPLAATALMITSRVTSPPHEHFDAMTAATIEPYSRPLTLQPFLRLLFSFCLCHEQGSKLSKQKLEDEIIIFDHLCLRAPADYNTGKWKIPHPSLTHAVFF